MTEQYKPYARCAICLILYTTDDFWLLSPCGHFLCINCIEKIFSTGKGSCPFCRTPIEQDLKDHLKPVSLQFVPDKVAMTERVVDGLNLMGGSSKLVSVLKTPGKLTQVVESLDVEQELANSLLQAINEFKERIVPVFKEAKNQRGHIQRLESELKERENQNEEFSMSTAKLRSLEDKMRETRKARRQAELERDRALEVAQKATDELCTVRDEGAGLKERVSTLEKGIETLKGYLQQHKHAERKHKAKIKHMQRHLAAEVERKAAADAAEAVHSAQENGALHLAEPDYIDLDDDTQNTESPGHRTEPDIAHFSVDAQRDFEGMPGPGFSSNWKPNLDEPRLAKKPKLANSRVKEITNFPVELDKTGRPTAPIQLGPRRKLRVHDPLR